MSQANGNGHVKSRDAAQRGAKTQFGRPDGPDPVASARKATQVREAAIQANITRAREYAAAHVFDAVSVMVDALKASPKDAPAWHVRLKAAKEIVDRLMGQAPQHVTHTQQDEFSKRVADLNAEMERLERDSARAQA